MLLETIPAAAPCNIAKLRRDFLYIFVSEIVLKTLKFFYGKS
jgi:hypothetical protein